MNGASIYFKSLVTIIGCALLFALITIPLIWRKIPRNGLYGFRTRKTLSSDKLWYDTNAYFGRTFLIGNFITAIVMVLLFTLQHQLPLEYFMKFSIAALVVPSVLAVIITFFHLRSSNNKF